MFEQNLFVEQFHQLRSEIKSFEVLFRSKLRDSYIKIIAILRGLLESLLFKRERRKSSPFARNPPTMQRRRLEIERK